MVITITVAVIGMPKALEEASEMNCQMSGFTTGLLLLIVENYELFADYFQSAHLQMVDDKIMNEGRVYQANTKHKKTILEKAIIRPTIK